MNIKTTITNQSKLVESFKDVIEKQICDLYKQGELNVKLLNIHIYYDFTEIHIEYDDNTITWKYDHQKEKYCIVDFCVNGEESFCELISVCVDINKIEWDTIN